MKKWIGVDFDQTLRRKDGTPVLLMVNRIRAWMEQGIPVRIVTARMQPRELAERDTCGACFDVIPIGNLKIESCRHDLDFVADQIKLWCLHHIGCTLPVQWGKSKGMIELWDDKVVRVHPGTGVRLSPSSVEEDE